MKERRALNRKLVNSGEKAKKQAQDYETENSKESTNAGSSKKDDDAKNFWNEENDQF
tara:strand:+ start:64 stop:234 length:171 start_codon:yes stop_codon:yes gene_type:complete